MRESVHFCASLYAQYFRPLQYQTNNSAKPEKRYE